MTPDSKNETPQRVAAVAPGSASLRACVETLAHELECDCNYNFSALSDMNGETFTAKLARVRAAAEVMEQWLRLCELGLQDVVPEWVRPSIEELWEKTDAVCKPNTSDEPHRGSPEPTE